MNPEALIHEWFTKWERGDFMNLPLVDAFKHTSPFGTIEGKQEYINIVNANKDKFLGYTFQIHDKLIGDNNACVRYTARQGDHFSLDVSEWFYFKGNLIASIVSYYHIGDIREERQFSSD